MKDKSKVRYGIVVYFGDGGWNILLQETGEGWINKHYFSSDEHYLDDSLDTLELFLENGGNYYEYEVPSYDIWCEAVDKMMGDDCDAIFMLPNKVIDGLEDYLKSKFVTHFPTTNATYCPHCGKEILENEYCQCPNCNTALIYEVNTL